MDCLWSLKQQKMYYFRTYSLYFIVYLFCTFLHRKSYITVLPNAQPDLQFIENKLLTFAHLHLIISCINSLLHYVRMQKCCSNAALISF